MKTQPKRFVPQGNGDAGPDPIISANQETTPLSYLLDILRDEKVDQNRRDWAAQQAAPYVHPKLQAVLHSGEMTHRHTSELSDAELQRIASGRSKRVASQKISEEKVH